MNLKPFKHGLFLFSIMLAIGIIKGIFFKPIFVLTGGNVYTQIWINSILAVIILVAIPLLYTHFVKLTKKEWIMVVIFLMVLTNIFNITIFELPRSVHESTDYVLDYSIEGFPIGQYANTVCFMHQIKIMNDIESKCLFMPNGGETDYFLYFLHNIVLYAVFLVFLLLGNSLNKKELMRQEFKTR